MAHITHVVFEISTSRDDFSPSPGVDDTVYHALVSTSPRNETTDLSCLHQATKIGIPMSTVHSYKHRLTLKKKNEVCSLEQCYQRGKRKMCL